MTTHRPSTSPRTSKASPVPHGAAGLYVLGSICEKGNRANHAIAYYELALEKDALMWVAYDALCRLGADVVEGEPGIGPLPADARGLDC